MISKWFYGAERTIRQSFFWTLLIVVSVSLLLSKSIIYPTDFQFVYRDTDFQLSAAINAHLCGSQHFIDPNMLINMRSSKVTDKTRLFAMPTFNNIPLSQYCSQHIKDMPTTIAIVKNYDAAEGLPLYWIDKAVLAVFGDMTFLQMAIIFRLLQIALTGIFAFYLLSIGVRWPSVWVITLLANFSNLMHLIQALNIHGFVLPCSLAIIALYGLCMRFSIYRRRGWHIVWLLIISALEFWLFYGRSSLLFTLVALNVLYILYLWQKSEHKYSAILTLLIVKLITISLISYIALIELGPTGLTRTHPVIHSVILGMATPNNSLAEEQGITWNDKVGLELVQRLNPQIDTLYTPEYNTTLNHYYVSLWKHRTHDMLGLYYLKFYRVSQNIINGLSFYITHNYYLNVKILFYPFVILNGFIVLVLLLALAVYFFYNFVKKMSNSAYMLLALTLLTFLNLLENALVSSVFSPRFQTNFIFGFLVWVYLFYGSVVYAVILLGKKLVTSRQNKKSR